MEWTILFIVIWILGVWIIGYFVGDDMGVVALWPIIVPLGIVLMTLYYIFMWPTLLRRRY